MGVVLFFVTVIYVGLEEGKDMENSGVCFKYLASKTNCEDYSFPFNFCQLICWEYANVLVQVAGRIITNFLQKAVSFFSSVPFIFLLPPKKCGQML